MSAILEHRGGAVSTVSFSFDIWESRRPLFEVYGTEGSVFTDVTRSTPINAFADRSGEIGEHTPLGGRDQDLDRHAGHELVADPLHRVRRDADAGDVVAGF